MDGISLSKDIKGGLNVIIDASVGWGINGGVGSDSCRCVGGKLKMSKVEFVWRLIIVNIKVFAEVLFLSLAETLGTK